MRLASPFTDIPAFHSGCAYPIYHFSHCSLRFSKLGFSLLFSSRHFEVIRALLENFTKTRAIGSINVLNKGICQIRPCSPGSKEPWKAKGLYFILVPSASQQLCLCILVTVSWQSSEVWDHLNLACFYQTVIFSTCFCPFSITDLIKILTKTSPRHSPFAGWGVGYVDAFLSKQ